MKEPKNLLAAGLALLLIACAAGYYATRDNDPVRPAGKQNAAALPSLLDEHLLQTARRVASLADTTDEQVQVSEALRLSDHELDVAFATALREANAPDAKDTATTGPQRQLAARIAELAARVAGGKEQVAQLTSEAATNPSASDQLKFANAQLELDQDDLSDATQDLARLGSDRHARLERALQEHEAAQQGSAPLPKLAAPAPADTLKEQLQQWMSLSDKRAAIRTAAQQAAAKAATLERQHDGLESKRGAPTSGPDNPDEEGTSAIVARLRRLSDQKKTLAEFDKRIEDSQQLAAAYQTWAALVDVRQRAMLHLLLRSLGAIFALVLLLLLAYRITLFAIRGSDRRHRHQVRMAAAIACELIGVIAILLIVFGPPTQLSTMLGLATAGLTVVLKDFIVGFIGWFVLMGRNGVRIGDWVEIDGVGGEVIEIGVLKTVLLEMGNWTSTGHPTGRRVSCSNSYAIEGHYFNFSTAGQWLWDELKVTLPSTSEPYEMAEQIRLTVEKETEAAAAEAAHDWERVTSQYGVTSFSAKPAVDLRPGNNGLDVVVRYITRAPLRYEVKSRLFQAIVGLLHAKGDKH